MSAIGVAESGQSLSETLRIAFTHGAEHNRQVATLLRMAGEDARAEEYDRRALIDGTRAKRFARIPVGRIAQ